jgi:diketogulonate reductase-like aldo/keto reductase
MLNSLQTKSGLPIHPIGIGTWGYGEYPSYSPGTNVEISAIQYAISLGQNHIDTAEMYAKGGAETVVGRAIESAKRDELFIASKLWKDHVGKDRVRPAVEAMLDRLKTDFLDVLYIHAPWFDAPWQEAISQIEELIDEGVVRQLGVSNFRENHLQEVLDMSRHPIAVNQLHYSCMHQQEVTPQLRDLCVANHIAIVAYMPIERGDILRSPLIAQMAKKYRATPSQIALAWLISQGTLPIPKSVQKSHIEDNAMASALQLSPEDVLHIGSLV